MGGAPLWEQPLAGARSPRPMERPSGRISPPKPAGRHHSRIPRAADRRPMKKRRLSAPLFLFQRLQLCHPQCGACVAGHPPRRRKLHIPRFPAMQESSLVSLLLLSPPRGARRGPHRRATDSSVLDHSSVSSSAIQRAALASLGIRQSPRGDRAAEPTLGPSGTQLRLNCWEKNLR